MTDLQKSVLTIVSENLGISGLGIAQKLNPREVQPALEALVSAGFLSGSTVLTKSFIPTTAGFATLEGKEPKPVDLPFPCRRPLVSLDMGQSLRVHIYDRIAPLHYSNGDWEFPGPFHVLVDELRKYTRNEPHDTVEFAVLDIGHGYWLVRRLV